MTQDTKQTDGAVAAERPAVGTARKPRGRPAATVEAEAVARIHAQTARARDAAAKAAREKAVLEGLVAESVRSDRLSVSWYDKAGVVCRDLAISVGAAGNADGLYALMTRHREGVARDQRDRGRGRRGRAKCSDSEVPWQHRAAARRPRGLDGPALTYEGKLDADGRTLALQARREDGGDAPCTRPTPEPRPARAAPPGSP